MFGAWRQRRLERKFWRVWNRLMPPEAQLVLHMRKSGSTELDPNTVTEATMFTGSEIVEKHRRHPYLHEVAGSLQMSQEHREEIAQSTAALWATKEHPAHRALHEEEQAKNLEPRKIVVSPTRN